MRREMTWRQETPLGGLLSVCGMSDIGGIPDQGKARSFRVDRPSQYDIDPREEQSRAGALILR